MSQNPPITIEKIIDNIEEEFNKAKNECSYLYKKIDESKTNNNNIGQFIEHYKNIINYLNSIKQESLALDNVPIPLLCFENDEKINEERKNNCNIMQAMAQHIRGCKQSFEKYNENLESNSK